jgi:hypothetical protein
MAEPKRTIKDSIFTFLFGEPEYTMELYQALHPEDTTVKDSDVKLVTLQNVLANGLYNDLGFQVRDKLILLVEAQSTFSENIPLRMLLYLAATYKDYVEEHKLSLYREKKVSIPRPELYVVYTGNKKHVPDELKLSSLFEGDGSVELSVKVLRDDGKGSIVDQYIAFSKIVDEQVKLHGRTDEALYETLRICRERKILKPFLDSREKEVVDIMTALFDQQKVWEIELHNVAQENLNEGEKKGENKLGLLMKALFAAHRFEDADAATTDEAKRDKLYKEFGIQ